MNVVKLKPLPVVRGNRKCGHQIVGISDFESSIVFLEKDPLGEERWHVKKNPTPQFVRRLSACRCVFPASELNRDEFLDALREFIRGERASVAMRPRKKDIDRPRNPEIVKAIQLGYFK